MGPLKTPLLALGLWICGNPNLDLLFIITFGINKEQFSDLCISLKQIIFNHFLLYLIQIQCLCRLLAFSELKPTAAKTRSHLSLPLAAERRYLQACAVGSRVTSLPCLARERDCTKHGSTHHCVVQENISSISFAFLPFFFSSLVKEDAYASMLYCLKTKG